MEKTRILLTNQSFEEVRKVAKGKAIFNENICKGCELCTTVCPVNIVAMQKDRINVKGYHPAGLSDEEKCIGCTNCALICPDCVITVERY